MGLYNPPKSSGGVTTIDGISGAVTLVGAGGITIEDNTPSAGDITILGSGGGPPGGNQYDVQLNNGSGGFTGSDNLNFQDGYLTINGDSGYGQLQFLNTPNSTNYGGIGIEGHDNEIIVGASGGDLSMWVSGGHINFSANSGSSNQMSVDGATGNVAIFDSLIIPGVSFTYTPPTFPQATTAYVRTTGNDSTGTVGNPALPFLTLTAAITAAIAHGGQTINFAGSYNIGSTVLDLSNSGTIGLNLIGDGHATSSISSSATLSSAGCIIKPGNGSITGGFTIISTCAPTAFSGLWGCYKSSGTPTQTVFTNAIAYDIYGVGFSDGFYVRDQTISSGAVCSYNAYNCNMVSTFDTSNLFLAQGSVVNYFNTSLIPAGPFAGSGGSGNPVRAVSLLVFGTVNFYGGTLGASGSHTLNVGAYTTSSFQQINLYNTTIATTPSGFGNTYDIEGNVNYLNATGSGTGGALVIAAGSTGFPIEVGIFNNLVVGGALSTSILNSSVVNSGNGNFTGAITGNTGTFSGNVTANEYKTINGDIFSASSLSLINGDVETLTINAFQSVNFSIGNGTSASGGTGAGDGSLAFGDGASTTNPSSIAIGSSYPSFGVPGATSTADTGVAIGSGSNCAGKFSVSLFGSVAGDFSFGLGSSANANGFESTAIGLAFVIGDNSVGIGAANTVEVDGTGSVAIGNNVKVTGDNSMALAPTGSGGTSPNLSGSGSLAVFMQDQHSRTLSANNMMMVLGGTLMVDPHTGAGGANITASRCTIDFGRATDALLLPTGSTAQQPGSPVEGMQRYNSTNNCRETYNNGAWHPEGTISTAFIPALTTAQTITSYPTPAVDGTYRIGGNVTITAIATDVAQLQVVYTDETNTSRTVLFYPLGLTSAALSATGAYTFPDTQIRVKASTTITVSVALTTSLGSITYNAGATIQQLA